MSKVVENYVLKEEIGRGDFCIVKKGKHITTHELVAVKIFKVENFLNNPHIQDTITQELHLLRCLDSPYIVKHLRYLRTSNNIYEVYKYYQGGDLKKLLEQQGHLSITESLQILVDLCQALKLVQSNTVIHAAIRPENIFLNESQYVGENRAILGDFGHLIILDSESDTTVKSVGITQYAAPEIICGQNYGLISDIYSIGVKIFLIILDHHLRMYLRKDTLPSPEHPRIVKQYQRRPPRLRKYGYRSPPKIDKFDKIDGSNRPLPKTLFSRVVQFCP